MISIQHVTKSFKGFKAVDDLSLQIQKNEYVALLGPNGAGKTTLVEMIEGLQIPDNGEIVVEGKNWKNDSEELRHLVGISLQETKFHDKITVLETLNLFGSFYKLNKARSAEVMELVGLEEKRKSFVVNLSGGQRQKLALGVAILNSPSVLMLDEPTTGLDPNARREIWTILQNLRKERGTTLLLTTHYMEEAETLCERIVIMDKGKILAQGAMADLLSSYSKGEIISFSLDRPVDSTRFENINGFKSIEFINPKRLKMEVDDITQSLPGFLEIVKKENLELKELECRKKTLDDLFVAMTGRRLDE